MGSNVAPDGCAGLMSRASLLFFTRGVFAAKEKTAIHPEATKKTRRLLEEKHHLQWNTLTDGVTTIYDPKKFCYIENRNLVESILRDVYSLHDRASLNHYINSFVSHCTTTDTTARNCAIFVLSKTDTSMNWHVDGGTQSSSDMVIYHVLGHELAVSCFMLVSIDPALLAAAQVEQADFPAEEIILAKLGELEL